MSYFVGKGCFKDIAEDWNYSSMSYVDYLNGGR